MIRRRLLSPVGGHTILLAFLGCTSPQATPDPDSAEDTSADTAGTDAEPLCPAAPAEARLELELHAFWGFDEARRLPGYLRSAIFRGDQELLDWLEVMEATQDFDWTFDWESEVALVGYLDTTVGRPTEFGLMNIEGLGTDELTSRWCVRWPTELADSDSRMLAAYAVASGSYGTLHESLRWANQEEHE